MKPSPGQFTNLGSALPEAIVRCSASRLGPLRPRPAWAGLQQTYNLRPAADREGATMPEMFGICGKVN